MNLPLSSFLLRKSAVLLLLGIYHLAFSFVAFWVLKKKGGDAFSYWFRHDHASWMSSFGLGTQFVKFWVYPFSQILQLPFYFGFLLFSCISLVGILQLLRFSDEYLGFESSAGKMMLCYLFLPGLHFWTSVIGKEALLFTALTFIIPAVARLKISLLFCIAFFIMILIRPHLAVILLITTLLTLLSDRSISTRKKLIVAFAGLGLTGIALLILINIQDFSGGFLNSVLRKMEVHREYMKHTGAYVPLEAYSLPLKLFTFWFRPLPGEYSDFFYTVFSLENLFILILALFALVKVIVSRRWKPDRLTVFVFFFGLLYSIIFSYAYSNYGLIYRTKILWTPFMLLIFSKLIFHRKNNV